MENKTEKKIGTYVHPEAETIVFRLGKICGGIEEGSDGGQIPWDDCEEEQG